MTGNTEQVIRLENKHIKTASRMLAKAFREDPIEKYAFPELGGDDPRMPYTFELMIRIGLKYGYAFTTSPRLEGAAVWARIKTSNYSFWRMLLAGAILPAMRMGWRTGQRMQAFSSKLEEKHREIISDTHWYLQLLGVDPEHQGKGYAGRLLRERLARIDEEALACYLETELVENVPIYEHFGFHIVEEYHVPGTPLKMWLMLRQPA
jgi:ribosomal protein S18 acetylase RimI-like enzyme